ncbi:MAG: hypothetical protein RQ826_09695 [Xanthomonadales bacterium]|nr:hypothetical protein [Xanthomonadales bacterium]
MNRYVSGLLASFIATVALSVLMLIKSAAGMLPAVNAIAMLAKLGNQYLGLPATPVSGWILHFLIGTVLWGLLFAATRPMLPGGGDVSKGIVFSVIAWVLMMLIPMPLAGAGWFGLNIGIAAPVATLVLHIIFGAVLGGVYARLSSAGVSAQPTTG